MKKVVLFFLLLTGIAKAQVLDQSNTGSANNFVTIQDFNTTVRQYFKAGLNGKLTRLDLDIETFACNSTTSMNFICNIYDTTYTNLISNELVTIPMPYSRGMFSVFFSSPAYLESGKTYIFEIFSFTQACDTGGTPTNSSFHLFHDLLDTNYPDGTAYMNPALLNSDFYFQTYVAVCNNPITVNPSVSANSFCGFNDGVLTCSPTGGDATLNFTWSNSATTQTNIGLLAGNYTITVSDGLNCSMTESITLPNTFTAVTAWDTIIHPQCPAMCNGSAEAYAITGTAPFNISWSSLETTNQITGKCAGTYNYTISDANGCTYTNSLTVVDPLLITALMDITNESCLGNDGAIDVTPMNGTPPYTFSWFHGPVTEDISGLTAALYQVQITDANGCMNNVGQVVGYDPGTDINVANMDIQNNLCNNINGHISGFATGITSSNPIISYTLNSVPITANGVYNLMGGSYFLHVMDDHGCTDTTTIFLQDIGSVISVGQGSTFNPTCPDVCNGTAMVGVAGGSLPYSYSWSNGLTVGNGTDLCPGEYSVVVTDADGCTGTTLITILEPASIDVSFNVTAPACGDNDGDAQVSITSGGTAPFTYAWSNGDVTDFADSLTSGTYSVMIEDAAGCTAFHTVGVSNSSGPSISSSLFNPLCENSNDGAIDLTITGGTAPIQIHWSTGHTTEDLTSLSEGVYDLTLTDAAGCLIKQSFQLTSPSPLTMTSLLNLPACGMNDGDILANVSGGVAPYSYAWDANAGNAITPSVISLYAGIYSLTVTDNHGCVKTFDVALSNDNAPTILTDQILQPNCQTGGGAIYTTVFGGTAPYDYSWSNGSTSGDLENVAEGNYALTVSDAGNCQAIQIYELDGINIFAQKICMITVDSLTNMNNVIWEKTYGIGIAEFKIYRQTAAPNFYLLVGRVPFDSLSIFHDTVASTDMRAWKYKLATVDSCGNESDFYAFHKTIHLNTEVNSSGDVLLEWDDYIGFPYSEFYINRYHVSNGWEIIDTVPSSVHTYLDQNAPSGNVGYTVTVPSPSDCEPTRAGVNTSRSNIKNASVAAPNEITEENLVSAFVYPNPAIHELNIALENYQGEIFTLKIYNAIGELILSQKITSASSRLDTKEIPSGVYTLSIASDKKSIIKKVMIVK